MSWLRRWVAFWDAREHPRVLGLIRMLFGLVVLSDFLEIGLYGLVTPLFSPQDVGGWADPSVDRPPLLYRVLPWEAWVGEAHWAVMVFAALFLTIGFRTRLSAFVLMMLWSQHQHLMPMADRAIDLLCRDVLFVLMLSDAGAWGSVDARIGTGSWWGDGAERPAWPRYLILTQLVVMYWTAGVQKVGFLWLPWGHFTALYVILQDPAIARIDFAWLRHPPFLQLTQLGTAVTLLWQWAYPLVFLWLWYKNTPERPGRLRAWSNRLHLHAVWVAIGAVFHLLLVATMELGIFPWAMLALYPVFLDPDELAAVGRRLKLR